MNKYIDIGYKPKKEDLVAEFYVEPNRISIRDAANHIAGESSIDTWSDIQTLSPRIVKRLKPHIFSINGNIVKIAYPSDLFEKGNVPQIMSSIAGNIFGMKAIKKLKLMDIHFPKSIVKSFKGPRFGIEGVRKILKVKKRPLLGTIVKPKVGLNSREHAEVAFNSWKGGLDIVKDDENLSSQKFNKFEERIRRTLKLRDKAEKITGERKVYMANVTAETNEMLRRAKFVKKHGGRYVMIDIVTSGWAALQTLRNEDLGLVIHAHRAGHAAFTRYNHGISMLVIAKIARLIGVDQIHIGAILGKMEGGKSEVKHIGEEIEKQFVRKEEHILEQKYYGLKSTFPVCSGGLHPGLLPGLVKIMGNNIIAQFGGGCHAHPNGTFSGAKAIRQAAEATMQKISLKEYSKTHEELYLAIKKWGT